MHLPDFTYVGFFILAFVVASIPLGRLIASVLEGRIPRILGWLQPVERLLLKGVCCGSAPEMSWRHYAFALVLFHGLGCVVLVLLQLLQGSLPLNPQGVGAVPIGVAVNTAVSFVTNTNWQAYSGEASLSYLTQMLGLGVQNFLSAATGLAVMAAVARGFSRRSVSTIGNFWGDLVRGTLYVLLPVSVILACVLAWEGVPMNFSSYVRASTLEGSEQLIPMGPAASQVAIKQLGTNGGGFFGQNSAHPFENPTPLSNFLQALSILLLPSACVHAFGLLVGARRHAWVLYGVMMVFFVSALSVSLWSEYSPHPHLDAVARMEGKELRFGVTPSVVWAMVTTVASNGSVNAMHASLSPLAGGFALFNMLLGEIIFGGIGSGVYGMVAIVILVMFLAGLMVGRSPEYLGKKLEAFEVKMAAVAVLVPCAAVLFGCAATFLLESGRSAVGSGGPHALSEVLYAWASMCNNNGSAFASLTATGGLFTWGGALAMLLGRFAVIVPLLALAGSLAAKKQVPASGGTFPTDGWMFAFLLSATLLIVVALTHFPSLALGPVLEHLLMQGGRSF